MNRKTTTKDFPHEFRRRTDIERTTLETVEREYELRAVIDETGLGIMDYYPLSGEMHWSAIAREHFGLSPDALVNYNVFLVGLHPDDRQKVEQLLDQSLLRESNGKFSASYRTVGIEDDKERVIEAHGRAFFNHDGEAVRFVCTTRDVTDLTGAAGTRSEDGFASSGAPPAGAGGSS